MGEKEILKEAGLKATAARIEILRYLLSTSSPISVEELHSSLKQSRIDLSTTYRTLSSFVDKGLVKKEIGRNKESLFLLAKGEECHYLVCLRCGSKTKLEGCPYHEVNEALSKKTGFLIQDHNTEIYGICPSCRKEGE